MMKGNYLYNPFQICWCSPARTKLIKYSIARRNTNKGKVEVYLLPFDKLRACLPYTEPSK